MPSSANLYELDYSLRDRLRMRIALLGMAMLLVVAALRFTLGQTVVGWIDLAWAAGLAAITGWMRYAGRRAPIGEAMAAISLGCSCVKIQLLGLPGLFWLLPVVLGCFAVTSRRRAAVLSSLAIAYASVVAFDFPRRELAVSFAVSAILLLAIAWVSAAYVESLRRGLEQLASRDALTGAGNRRALEEALRRMDDASTAHDALAVLDLDHFKQVNDRHGHAAGDRVLAETAALVRQLLRPQDRLFRFGGEEFVLLMPDIDAADAHGLLALIQAAVRQKIRVRQEPVTLSAGLAQRRAGENTRAWMARADAALYRAKTGGRDRVVDAGAAVEAATLPPA